MRTPTFASLLVAFALGELFAASSPTPQSSAKRIKSSANHFSFDRPKGWYVGEFVDPPVLISFPASEFLPQGELPPGGATIFFRIKLRPGGTTESDPLLQLARSSMEEFAGGGSLTRRPLDAQERPSQVDTALECSFLGMGSLSYLHYSEIVFPLKQQFIEVILNDLTGDRRSNEHERALRFLVRSFRVDGP